jgi:hypothetical protein
MDGTNGILVFVLQYCILQYEHVYLGRCCRGWCGQVNKGANPSIVKKKSIMYTVIGFATNTSHDLIFI